MVVYLML